MSPTSQYFNHNSHPLSGEQLLLEDLINEQIRLFGYNVYYILRESLDEIDDILGEDPASLFEKAYMTEMAIMNLEEWSEGDNLFSKFGLNINKQTSLVVTRRAFNKNVGNTYRLLPHEGDLVYIPIFDKIFEIKKVNKEEKFFAHGKREPYFYELDVEMFKYSHEPFNTAVSEIDNIEVENAYVITLALGTGANNFVLNEVVYQGASLGTASATAQVKSWNSSNNSLDIYNIKGEFDTTANVVGDTSGAEYTLSDYDDMADPGDHDYYQNDEFENTANDFIQTTETNPFGNIS